MGTTISTENLEERVVAWARQHQRAVTIAAGALAIVAGGGWFWWSARERRENFAERALQTARASAEAGNLPLAASDLSRVVGTYGGTRAADQAALLLAQVRLLEGQDAVAATDLRNFIASRPRREFVAPANALLGAALEEAGQVGEAAKAYEQAANASRFQPVESQHLLDAARTYTLAGDTGTAARLYERIIREHKEEATSVEAMVRLGELRPLRGV